MLTKKATKREVTDNPTAGYQRPFGAFLPMFMGHSRTSEPWFLWSDVPIMGRDPAIKIGLRILRSRFRKVRVKAVGGPPEVKRFILKTWKKFWYSSLPKLLTNYYKWGRAPGGVEWTESGRRGLELDTVRALEPWDVTPFVYTGGKRRNQFAGFAVNNTGHAGQVYVTRPHAFYFCGFEEFSQFCDEPRIAGAYAPWLEKNAPTGLRSSRRLYYWTRALGLTVVRHPDEKVRMPNGSEVHSEVLAIQAGVLAQNGSVVAMPSTLHPGDSSKFKWDLEQRQGQSDTARIGEAVEQADEEIWYGMGILPEIVQSGDSGGYAGRSVSMETWLADADLEAGMWDHTFRTQVLAPIIRIRFGVEPSEWDYELNSLLNEYLASATPHGPSNQSPSPQEGGGSAGGSSGFNPDGHVTPSGHQWLSNGASQHRYLSSMARAKVDLSQWSEADHPRGQPENAGEFASKPNADHIEKSPHRKQIKPGVEKVQTPDGNHFAVKGRGGIPQGPETEAKVSELAEQAGVNMPRSHLMAVKGQHSVVTPWVEGTPLDKFSPEQRQQLLKGLPKEEIDKQVLFDYLVAHGDVHNGNYILSPDGKKLYGIDKEMSLQVGGMGENTHWKIPNLLSDVAPQGAELMHDFDPATVKRMVAAGHQMATHLELKGDKEGAKTVRKRTAVLQSLAGNEKVTAGDLWKAGKRGAPSTGFLSRLFGG